jgi:hypothetical protein
VFLFHSGCFGVCTKPVKFIVAEYKRTPSLQRGWNILFIGHGSVNGERMLVFSESKPIQYFSLALPTRIKLNLGRSLPFTETHAAHLLVFGMKK